MRECVGTCTHSFPNIGSLLENILRRKDILMWDAQAGARALGVRSPSQPQHTSAQTLALLEPEQPSDAKRGCEKSEHEDSTRSKRARAPVASKRDTAFSKFKIQTSEMSPLSLGV